MVFLFVVANIDFGNFCFFFVVKFGETGNEVEALDVFLNCSFELRAESLRQRLLKLGDEVLLALKILNNLNDCFAKNKIFCQLLSKRMQ